MTHVEWRQSKVAPPSDESGVPELIALVRDEIEASGPITFARFMSRALYEPGLGYYSARTDRPTRSGDFLTAPELHPIFGHVLAHQVEELWLNMGRPIPFTLREYGTGTGTLFLAIFDELRRCGSALIDALRYQPVDQAGQLDLLREALAAAGVGQKVDSISTGRFTGCVIANEFLDALPVHRVVVRNGRLRELHVDWANGGFVASEGEPSNDRLDAWFAATRPYLDEGQQAEVNLAQLEWLHEIGRDLERGYVFLFDYGAPAAELYPGRPTGTLRAFAGQHVSSDIMSGIGRRDLTAHIDLDALERGAQAAGLDFVGRTRQARFLLGCGLDEVYAKAREQADQDWNAALTLRSAIRRLLDPQALGGYAAVVLGRGVEGAPLPSGLAAPG